MFYLQPISNKVLKIEILDFQKPFNKVNDCYQFFMILNGKFNFTLDGKEHNYKEYEIVYILP